MNDLNPGIRLGMAHAWAVSTGRFGRVCLGISVLWTALFSLVARQAGISDATTQALVGPIFGVAVPIAVLLYARHLASSHLSSVIADSSLLGVSPPGFAAGAWLAAAGCSGALSALLALLSVAIVRGSADAALARDLITTGWIGFLGGAAYASVFVSLSQWTRGWWMFSFFLADWLLGSGTSAWTGLWPRAHLANLLGANVALPHVFAISTGCLWGFCALGAALFVLRTRA